MIRARQLDMIGRPTQTCALNEIAQQKNVMRAANFDYLT
ncbi:hypothetical protein BSU04_12750 [Caballeronia sordidicola]|uniref:Uncharacterized protein n=1 Tax=Caballeronia sordidicola TaxID=196367 RepID=A0A226X466_CABSO|nr:hypothetical protein BSU04_12750 [Caballeronia sordidicola]